MDVGHVTEIDERERHKKHGIMADVESIICHNLLVREKLKKLSNLNSLHE